MSTSKWRWKDLSDTEEQLSSCPCAPAAPSLHEHPVLVALRWVDQVSLRDLVDAI